MTITSAALPPQRPLLLPQVPTETLLTQNKSTRWFSTSALPQNKKRQQIISASNALQAFEKKGKEKERRTRSNRCRSLGEMWPWPGWTVPGKASRRLKFFNQSGSDREATASGVTRSSWHRSRVSTPNLAGGKER